MAQITIDFENEDKNLKYIVEKPFLEDGPDSEIRAKVHCDYTKDKENPPYHAEIKLTGSSVKRFANDVCDINGLDRSLYANTIKADILGKKAEIKQRLDERLERLQKEREAEGEGITIDENVLTLNNCLQKIYEEDISTVEDLEKEDGVSDGYEFISKNNDYIILGGDELILTDKGEQKAEKILGISGVENVEEEANKQLENDPLGYYLDQIGKMHKGDQALKVWELVSALSSKCSDTQIHSWAVGPSGKGKSHIKRRTIPFLPEDSYFCPNSMSSKAMLYYTEEYGSDVFKNKLLFLDEVDGYKDEDSVVMLRGLTDPDEDTYEHMTVKDQMVETLTIEKPITVWFTSVESMNDEQLKNRFILTNPDGSSELDEKVYKHQKNNLHLGNSLDTVPAEAEVVKEMLSKIRKRTGGLTPIIPFDVEWKQKFNRRLYPYFVTLMEIIAKIHYKNRVIKKNYIYVTKEDFELAKVIWSELIDTTIAQTDVDSLKIVHKLPEEKSMAMTTSDLANNMQGFSTEKVRRKVKDLLDTEELALINSDRDGNTWKYWAGRDKERLVNPEPEIDASPETVTEMLEYTDHGADQDIIDSVLNSDIPVKDMLQEIRDKNKQAKLDEVEADRVELDKDEQTLLRELEDFSFKVDLNYLYSNSTAEEPEQASYSLESRGLININDTDNGLKAEKTGQYKSLKSQGKIIL